MPHSNNVPEVRETQWLSILTSDTKHIRKKGFGPRETQVALGVSRDSKDLKDYQRSKEPRLLPKLTHKCRIYLKTPRDTPKTSVTTYDQ